MKDRVRSLEQVGEELRGYLLGWKGYFQLAQTPQVFRRLDQWVRHRLRAYQLKPWRRGTTVFRELVRQGMSEVPAAQVASNTRRWWHNSAMEIHIASPNVYFDELGVPRLAD
jgi:hypothetical protein